MRGRNGWIDKGLVCHMAHPPSKSTDKNYSFNKKNHELYDWMTTNLKTKEQLLSYMQNLEYVKRFQEKKII